MARPRKIKNVSFEPGVTYFKPRAIPLNQLEEVEITIDELETLRLNEIERLGQEKAAGMMGIHQSTFQRTLSRAREKVADALVNGKAIKIEGGEYSLAGKGGGKQGRQGRGKMAGPLSEGSFGVCVCPACGHEQDHVRNHPCSGELCERCGTRMTRRYDG